MICDTTPNDCFASRIDNSHRGCIAATAERQSAVADAADASDGDGDGDGDTGHSIRPFHCIAL